MTSRAEQRVDFDGGYPTPDTVGQAFDDVDLNRAIASYRFFYRTVSGAAIFDGTVDAGAQPNTTFGYMDTQPRHVGFTLNSDTPYGGVLLDLRNGPMVVELPAGPFIGAAMDIHQRWIQDLGIPGPDAGKGGRHLLLPPGYEAEVPSGYHVGASGSYRVIVGLRSLPEHGDVPAAIERLENTKVYPMNPAPEWAEPTWFDMTPAPQDTTPHRYERDLGFWEVLHGVVQTEPPLDDSPAQYGDLAALGIAKGEPFDPDDRLSRILVQAAGRACAQMRVESFADRRPDRVVWDGLQWQWAALRFENGDFDTPNYRDTYAIDKWFFQAIATSPSMFRRDAGAGSLYWLGLKDDAGSYLDGGNTYKLTVPLPVPAKLFWSITVYDAETRSQIQTDQGKAALRSLFELSSLSGSSADLYFGPQPPTGREGSWIKTTPGRGWFAYFRIYGPDQAAFDGSWKPSDFEVDQT
ncbi:DUF1254 domain-containing protein [Mycobacterium yunnanensis]|uniref:DUF1254 domain-containing protein n=1 Tax=Mycobacterium yunnanensis TaxID=368477 RepID=A0A9X3BSF4_9MYCO|nr:DUF1254 domain-containing protein [Mycobacterium yunnanensis]MCV7420529.1 DUF1254 domain-containing protein [Mycobacterium yunnanensis]